MPALSSGLIVRITPRRQRAERAALAVVCGVTERRRVLEHEEEWRLKRHSLVLYDLRSVAGERKPDGTQHPPRGSAVQGKYLPPFAVGVIG